MKKTLATYSMILRKKFVDYCNGELQELGLSQGLLYFILYIGKHPSCSPGLLSERLHMDTGHTARSVEKLVQTGFVTRERDEHDRRAMVLGLTDQGAKAFKRSYELFDEWDRLMLGDVSGEDRETLFRILERVLKKKEGDSHVRYC